MRKPLQSLGLGLISQEIFFIEYGHDGYQTNFPFDSDSKKVNLL
jgi:hypothetical protein